MRKWLGLSWALLLAGVLCLAQQSKAQLPLFGVGAGAPGGAASASYAYLGNYTTSNVGAAAATAPFTMPGGAGCLIFTFAVQNNMGTTPTVVFDPTGQNVTLTAVGTPSTAGYPSGIWSGTIAAASGTKNIVVTGSGSFNFEFADGYAWLGSNLISCTAQTSLLTAGGGASGTLNTTAGNFMLGAAYSVAAPSFTYANATTVTPSNTHLNGPNNFADSADWNGNTGTNTPFTIQPSTAVTNMNFGTWH